MGVVWGRKTLETVCGHSENPNMVQQAKLFILNTFSKRFHSVKKSVRGCSESCSGSFKKLLTRILSKYKFVVVLVALTPFLAGYKRSY